MLPLKLELKNFMAYRDCDPLDFSGLHTVVLTGENGAGKSTLLDAITWVLWGEARAKREDELIAQGATEMRVALTFSEGKNIYQVVRSRKLGKATSKAPKENAKAKAISSTGMLDFLVKDEREVSGWRSLAEPKTAETQAQILREINLTYETFVNSAFLKQGRADEFLLRSPAERKELLGEILNLAVWAGYEERTKDKVDAVKHEQDKRDYELNNAAAEISKLPEYERMLGEAKAAAREAKIKLDEATAAEAEMNRQREQARGLQQQVAQTQTRINDQQAQLAKLQTEREKHAQAFAQYQTALDERHPIEKNYALLESGRAQNNVFNEKLSSLSELNPRKQKAEFAIAEARKDLQRERDTAQKTLESLWLLADGSATRVLFEEATRTLHAANTQQRQRAQLETERNQSSEQQGEAKAENTRLRTEMNTIKTRMTALKSVNAVCPTCGRTLGETERAKLLADWEREGKQLGDTFRANEALTKQLQERLALLNTTATELDAALKQLPTLQRRVAELETKLQHADEATAQLPSAESALQRLNRELTQEQFAPEARVALSAVAQELAVLGYDKVAHDQLKTQLKQLEVYADKKAQLDKATLGMESEQRALHNVQLQAENIAKQGETEQALLTNLQAQLAEISAALAAANDIAATTRRLQDDAFKAQRREIEANQRVQASAASQQTHNRLSQEIDVLKQQQSLLEELKTAFGKNGVPAMIIESVLPELEASANELLGKMSKGKMNVRFETQRLTQSGSVSETLDLRINDDLGERAYEMFSGGEAFRVNFAVRIALSKLLAHRAGARLQTLFIDEGFGTQDAQGREALVEAINAIAPEFERIVIITHIEELKDAFPVRIEVSKSAHGSVMKIL